jgi:hypothetical protein
MKKFEKTKIKKETITDIVMYTLLAVALGILVVIL